LIAKHWPFLRRLAFVGYAMALFVATHWPALKIEGTGRPDLWIHLGAFGLWTLFLINARFFGPSISVRSILIAGGIGVVYAAIDESLQAIPWVRRHAAVDDFVADCGGVFLGCLVAWIVTRVQKPGKSPLSSPPP